MLFTLEKLTARIQELDEFRYRDKQSIPSFHSLEDTEGNIGERPLLPLSSVKGSGEMQLGERWEGRDRYLWLAAQVDVPASWQGRKIVGRFDFGKGGGGNNAGFESLLYVNGQPYQGVDTNHQEVFFAEESAGTTVSLCFRLWSGLGGYKPLAIMEHQLKRAELCWLDADADDLYYTARAALQVIKVLHEHSPERQLLLSAADRAFLLVDWSRPGSADFYASLTAAAESLRTSVQQLPKQHAVTVRCIGHTHIDVAWLWRLKHTREKAARSFSTVLRLMELFPDYVFLQTMPQLYDYIKTDYPDIYAQIQERVKEGRWEAGGGMWLEADCNLTSGESLVRQLLYGTRFLRDEFGTECTYLWLPDVFGYSWALPQILKKSGIDTFMTTKISWNQYNRMPHDTFQWRGIDGTEVLTHFITTPDNAGGWLYTYNGEVTASSVNGIWETYRDKPVNRELLLAYGYGDGGGGVNREMLELRRRLSELPGVPNVTTGRVDEYFAELQQTIAQTDEYVHTWDGELYLELHRGTYTSQAYNKRMNRKLELLARETEWLGIMGSLEAGDWSFYDRSKLAEAWKIVLRNQFHDIIPGSSIQEVYDDSRLEYEEAERLLQAANNHAASVLTVRQTETGIAEYTVWNSSGWERGGLVLVQSDRSLDASGTEGVWKDEQGNVLASQRSVDGWLVQVQAVPSLGSSIIRYCSEESENTDKKPHPFITTGNGIETPHYSLHWNGTGQLTSIWDKMSQREVLAAGSNGNVLQVFEDKPKSRHEAWDIDIYYQEKTEEIRELTSIEVVENGPVRAVVRFAWKYKDSTITQQLIVYSDSRRIDFKTIVDWHEQRKLLKAAFPVEIRSTEASYDIQFGNVKRPTHWNTSWDYARFEVVGHQWADLSERGYGVSLLNDCKYGYDIKDNLMRLTLIKSALVPDPQADQGHHEFTYSLLPHSGDWLEGRTVQEAWDLNVPLVIKQGAVAVQTRASLFRLSSEHVHIDAVKKAEDSSLIVLRFHEFAGQRGWVELSSDYQILSWQESDLMERPIGEVSSDAVIRLAVKPYEIKTLLIEIVSAG
ncbi:alpha-mannosidase [Paenibacillus radicis (ex Xue et al. 2023)]|uniref:Alpha-mannosidase n=1 Tax=Paenibacillus radicis (ex Xue et al. 2023) TaxID=2972489 RepID=A0ABT1YLX7_9BACL|nr:alpha-mannosidase [Paenibacillus radicis (ex Xue et al. 2023)]MCR8633268.1 alpha-mannosidase [Paenibacillus radicis (ex Xue et al. 2023)]